MERIILVKPDKEYEQKAKEFIQEFKDYDSKINGTGGLDRHADDYDGWLKKLENDLDADNLEPGKVPANTYFAIRESDERIVGMINIRHQLNDYLLKKGGNIGYSVRPTERRKGYATEILYLGLEKCEELGLEKVLLTCDKENIGSVKTIQAGFGVLENEVPGGELAELIQRYWIDVKYAVEKKKNL
jgi:predicted acetyltransferase